MSDYVGRIPRQAVGDPANEKRADLLRHEHVHVGQYEHYGSGIAAPYLYDKVQLPENATPEEYEAWINSKGNRLEYEAYLNQGNGLLIRRYWFFNIG